MACASVSIITQLPMHHTLHDKFCLHCDLSLEFFKPLGDGSRVTRLLCWTLGNESDCIMLSYVWKTKHLPATTGCSAPALQNTETDLHKSYGSLSKGWNMYCMCGGCWDMWKMTDTSLEEHISVDKECNPLRSVSAAT